MKKTCQRLTPFALIAALALLGFTACKSSEEPPSNSDQPTQSQQPKKAEHPEHPR